MIGRFMPKKKSFASSLVLLPLFISASTFAEGTSQVLSASFVFLGDSDFPITINTSEVDSAPSAATFDSSGNASFSLAWGMKQANAQFQLEYYLNDMDLGVGDSSSSGKVDALYYSGYWTPMTFFGVQAVLGAGVGYGRQDFSQLNDGFDHQAFESEGFVYKFSLGANYQVCPQFGVYGVFEQHNYDDRSDSYAGSEMKTIFREMAKTEFTTFSLGVSYSF